MDKVRVLVVGAGVWGREHCVSIKRIPNAELVGVVSRSLERALKIGAEMGVRSFTSISEAIEMTQPDAVTISLPHGLHLNATLEAIKYGMHVYVEKSFGASLRDAQLMTEAARARGVKIMAGFSQRYISNYHEMVRLARSGEIGRIRYVFAKRQSTGGFIEGHWTSNLNLAGGGALAGWGAHDVDLVIHIAGSEPKCVYAMMEFDEKGRDIQSHVLIRCNSGAICETEIEYYAFGTDCFAWVLGEKGRVNAAREGKMTIMREGLQPEERESPHKEWSSYFLTEALRAFVESILNNTEPPIPAEDGVRVWKVIEAAYRSAQTGDPVKIL
jgi:predicted dehydrogenase